MFDMVVMIGMFVYFMCSMFFWNFFMNGLMFFVLFIMNVGIVFLRFVLVENGLFGVLSFSDVGC